MEYQQPHTETVADTTDLEKTSDNIRASWNWSADQIRQNTQHYTEEEREALMAFYRWNIDPRHPMRRDEAARRVGYSPNLIYQVMTGIYRNPDKSLRRPPPELIERIREFLELEAKRFALGETKFVLTPTARKFHTACDLARESQSIVFIWGPSHIGKTWAAQNYAQTHNHGRTIYARLRAASGLRGMVARIADCCGISDNSNTDALVERIKRSLSANTLLILDECHLLFDTYQKSSANKCFEKLREIHDETGGGMVLIFTILDEIKARSQKELQQLWRRGVHKVPLPTMPTRGDLAAILKHAGLDFPEKGWVVRVKNTTEEPYEVLRFLARTEGLKAITERIRYARKLAGRAEEHLKWEHFCDAHLRIAKQAEQEGEW